MTQIEQLQTLEKDRPATAREASPVAADLRAMGAFVALIAITAVLLHLMITAGLRRIDTSRFGVANAIVDGTINADILVAGSSRALTHYDPRIIGEKTRLSAYNIGLNGAQTDMQLARVKTYLRHNKAPLALLFNLDAFSFQVTHGGVFDPGQFMPYLGEPDIYAALQRIDRDIWKSRFIPLYGYTVQDLRFHWIMGLAGLFRWRPAEDHFLGFEPRHTLWTDDFERLRQTNPEGVRFEIEAAGVAQMEELLTLCRDRGIRLILVYSPEYLDMQKMTQNRAEIFARFEALSRAFGAQLWDYSGSPISADRQNFYNSQHLNADGAEKFSSAIAERLSSDPALVAARESRRAAAGG